MLLQHRVVMAPLTRFRADAQHVPLPHITDYYAQRASVPGTLLITEGTFIAQRAGGYANVPGIWSDAQIAAWKNITDAVHAKKSFIYLQLWALGRTATPSVLFSEDPSFPFVSASNIPPEDLKEALLPRPLSVSEIQEYVELYATAASNAVHRAGFDGVEVHGANGYLVDQFLQDVSNVRADEYGGSPENRTRFALEVVDAITRRVGESKTAIRISPWGSVNSMGMQDPKPTFGHLVKQLRALHPGLSFIHAVEPRVSDGSWVVPNESSNDFIRRIWVDNLHDSQAEKEKGNEKRRVMISAGGYTRDLGMGYADKNGDLIAYGRLFIANPDLPYRLFKNIKLNVPERKYFYGPSGTTDPRGYTDYPFAHDDGVQVENKL